MMAHFAGFSAYLFDLDGCIYEGDQAMPAARELVAALRAMNKKVAFLSNNSSQSAGEVAEKLRSMQIEVDAGDIFLPTNLAGEFLLESFGQVSVYAIAGLVVAAAIVASGHRLATEADQTCDVVFVARDIDFSFAKLEKATAFLQRGATLVAANPDASHPGNAGLRVPETGALVASIMTVAGHQATVMGKPEPYLFRKSLASLGVDASQAVMIGDNLHTDIAGAHESGLASVWINSRNHLSPGSIRPGRECRHLEELLRELTVPGGLL